MNNLLEILSGLDWLLLPGTIGETFIHADWKGAAEGGLPGVVSEAAASIAGTNSYPFFVPLDSGWGPGRIQALLASKGIKMWGIGFALGEMCFRVSKRQAGWAQYLMECAGVPLQHRLYGGGSGGPAGSESQNGRTRVVGEPSQPPGYSASARPAPAKGSAGQGSGLQKFLDNIGSWLDS